MSAPDLILPTPLPWTMEKFDHDLEPWLGRIVVRAPTAPGGILVSIGGLGMEEVANMEMVCKAVNSHARLVEGVSWLAQTVHRAHHNGDFWRCSKNTCDYARQVLRGSVAVTT